jgi:hypothetical protein
VERSNRNPLCDTGDAINRVTMEDPQRSDGRPDLPAAFRVKGTEHMSLRIEDLPMPAVAHGVRRYLVADRQVLVSTDDSGLTTVRAHFGPHRAITGHYLNDTDALTAFHNEFDGRYAATLPGAR